VQSTKDIVSHYLIEQRSNNGEKYFMECMENGKRNTKPESSSSADKPTSLTA
jgi:hypothetical protein